MSEATITHAIDRTLTEFYADDSPHIVRRAILAALHEAGLALVPVEPTEAMLRAWFDTERANSANTIEAFRPAYRAMIAAAGDAPKYPPRASEGGT